MIIKKKGYWLRISIDGVLLMLIDFLYEEGLAPKDDS